MKTSYHIGYLTLFVILIGGAFIEGFRMPSLWSINYYLPSFFDGFFRRALSGTILSVLGESKFHYYTIASIQISVLFALLGWIYYAFQKNILLMLMISFYLLSPAGAFLFHEVGYIEQLLFLILFVSIALFPKHKAASLMIFSTSILFHELALLATLPIYFTYIYDRTGSVKNAVLYTLPSLLLFVVLYGFFQTVPFETAKIFTDKIRAFANYQLRIDYYNVFLNQFIGTRSQFYYNLNTITQLLMLFSFSVLSGQIIYRLYQQKLLSLFVFGAGVAPLLLGFFGYDLNRWFFLSLSSSTTVLVLIFFSRHTTLSVFMAHQKLFIGFVVLYALIISKMYFGYFDGYKARVVNLQSCYELKNELKKIPSL